MVKFKSKNEMGDGGRQIVGLLVEIISKSDVCDKRREMVYQLIEMEVENEMGE